MSLLHWLETLTRTDAPALPSLELTQLWLRLGWGVVLAWLGSAIAGWWSPRSWVGLVVALLLLASAWLPDPFSPAYWLGLAFQLPSTVTVLLSALLLWRRARKVPHWWKDRRSAPAGELLLLVVMGAGLGWLLLLDTFAVLPVQLYAWGFSPLAAGLLAFVVLLPWFAGGRHNHRLPAWVAPGAVLVFVALRLPTGNVWDAVLDPWLWLALQVYLVRVAFRRY
jgi:hypothetical protein